MQKTDVGIATQDLLTLQFQDQTQHSVSGGMLGSKVDGEMARIDIDTIIDLNIFGDGRSERGGSSHHVPVDVVVVGSGSAAGGDGIGGDELPEGGTGGRLPGGVEGRRGCGADGSIQERSRATREKARNGGHYVVAGERMRGERGWRGGELIYPLWGSRERIKEERERVSGERERRGDECRHTKKREGEGWIVR